MQNKRRGNDDSLSRIEGRNAVREALRAGKTVERLYVQEGLTDPAAVSIVTEAQKKNIQVRFVKKERLDEMSETGSHQGVIASVSAYEYGTVEQMLAAAAEKGEDPFRSCWTALRIRTTSGRSFGRRILPARTASSFRRTGRSASRRSRQRLRPVQ